MNQKEIDEINKTIPFVDAKILWKKDYGWTSQYWEKMHKTGWRMVQSKEDPEIIIIQDENGTNLFSAHDRITLLQLLLNCFSKA
ncbi:MAG TPA: hypothetical protein DCK76_06490 [Desulfotomaculum sp.]|nr:MAG: hypothetical protein XD84_1789 [Desulfotomaculum sp. 46_80]HAG11023.1 hypothetical protein [Desulfotomaculum sp.]HBY04898.1 hypothetical protein [Desulfotomaculum sp.]